MPLELANDPFPAKSQEIFLVTLLHTVSCIPHHNFSFSEKMRLICTSTALLCAVPFIYQVWFYTSYIGSRANLSSTLQTINNGLMQFIFTLFIFLVAWFLAYNNCYHVPTFCPCHDQKCMADYNQPHPCNKVSLHP